MKTLFFTTIYLRIILDFVLIRHIWFWAGKWKGQAQGHAQWTHTHTHTQADFSSAWTARRAELHTHPHFLFLSRRRSALLWDAHSQINSWQPLLFCPFSCPLQRPQSPHHSTHFTLFSRVSAWSGDNRSEAQSCTSTLAAEQGKHPTFPVKV